MAGALVTVVCATGMACLPTVPASAGTVPLDTGDCKFGGPWVKEVPWSLQRLLTDQMWADGNKGQGVKVAVIDTGVDAANQQIKPAISGSKSFVGGDARQDEVGHGTKVAGIIAARQMKASGFYGLAPESTVLALQTASDEKGGTAARLATAIDYAVKQHVDIINISQGTEDSVTKLGDLAAAVTRADAANILIVASAGNDGADGKVRKTYPAAFENKNVLAVAASDRNNERAPFSQAGDFVDLAAPGVNMVSDVPDGGNCVDQGTSFAAPYAAGAAALVASKAKAAGSRWTPQEIIWHLEQTADRVRLGRDDNIGWGVVDPVKAVNDFRKPTAAPVPDKNTAAAGAHVRPVAITLGESAEQRQTRYAIYILGGTLLLVAAVVGGSIALRDWRRKNGITTHGEA
ncbi:S8 family serine peptidase [Streptomyces sp. NPDC059740]|uniref:S8 family serine peptidase n=1 Tax=Streptomyces sp. NPDC059740 TaxID=3346926 RepID=UPI00365D0A32